MSRIRFITNLIGISLFLVSSITMELFAFEATNEAMSAEYMNAADEIFAERLRNIDSEVDLRFTREVRNNILQYTRNYRIGSERLLGKAEIYFPLFDEEIEKRDLPKELKYIAIIESNLKPNARSRVGATGMWQFMRATAKLYNLEMNNTIDERRDPSKSTKAAMHYLSDLYEMFDDWTLALAAYNCGPGRVQKAMKKAQSRNYWKVRDYLPRETREYIPRFIAVNYLMNYYKAHDLQPRKASEELVNTASTEVYNELQFKDIASLTGIELDIVKQLNPAYIRHYIPENNNGFTLTLPRDHMDEFEAERHQRTRLREIEKLKAKLILKMLLPKSDFPDKIKAKFDVPARLPEVARPVSELDKLRLLDIAFTHDMNGKSKEALKIQNNSKTRIKYVKLERTQYQKQNSDTQKKHCLSAVEYEFNDVNNTYVIDRLNLELIL